MGHTDKAEVLYRDALETLDMALAAEGEVRAMLMSVAMCIRDHARSMPGGDRPDLGQSPRTGAAGG